MVCSELNNLAVKINNKHNRRNGFNAKRIRHKLNIGKIIMDFNN